MGHSDFRNKKILKTYFYRFIVFACEFDIVEHEGLDSRKCGFALRTVSKSNNSYPWKRLRSRANREVIQVLQMSAHHLLPNCSN